MNTCRAASTSVKLLFNWIDVEEKRICLMNPETQSILVVGGGMSGITAAIEAAEAGYDVNIVEKNSYWGGSVPPGFAISIDLYRRFVQEIGAIEEISRYVTSLGELKGLGIAVLGKVSQTIQGIV